MNKNQIAIDSVEPLIESGILNFDAFSVTLTIDETLSSCIYELESSTIVSFRILEGTKWVGVIRLDSSHVGSCAAEFITVSLTNRPLRDNYIVMPDVGEDIFDTTILRKLDGKTPLLCNVMWIREEFGISFREGVGQIHVDAWNTADKIKKRFRLG